MKEIDFLPRAFHEAARHRRRRRWYALCGAGLAAVLAVLHLAIQNVFGR